MMKYIYILMILIILLQLSHIIVLIFRKIKTNIDGYLFVLDGTEASNDPEIYVELPSKDVLKKEEIVLKIKKFK